MFPDCTCWICEPPSLWAKWGVYALVTLVTAPLVGAVLVLIGLAGATITQALLEGLL